MKTNPAEIYKNAYRFLQDNYEKVMVVKLGKLSDYHAGVSTIIRRIN